MRLTLRSLIVILGVLLLALPSKGSPNFLIIIADDCTYNDLPLYGGANAKTPHIDRLASRGLVFNHAYLAEAMCQPCRAELYTGLYPMSNGCAWNHSASRPDVKSLPHYLKPLGYRVGLAGKTHVKPVTAYPFDEVSGFDKSCVRNPTEEHDLNGIEKYMNASDDPFCLVVALVEPHVPWVMGDSSQYPPARIKLPPNIADTPTTREHFSNYLAEITYMDSQVGEILQSLSESGKEKDTLVLFSSEQGSQFPGCKWTNWNTGIHTALIAAWPEKIAPATRTDALVQYADIAPTLIDIANTEKSNQAMEFDGSSFLGVLLGQKEKHRKYVFGIHNNLPEGPSYPIRTVFDGEYRLIRNLLPDEIYIEKHLMGGGRLNNPYWATWVGADPLKNGAAYELVKRYMRRPAEQLYQSSVDTYELNDLSADPSLHKVKVQLNKALDEWMEQQKDPGAAVDTNEALQAARQGRHLY